MQKVITIPFVPRKEQLEFWNNRRRFSVLVCHRRLGKTVYAVNVLQREALETKVNDWRGAYIAPIYKQAKSVAWDYLKEVARVVPGVKINESELKIDYPNGSRINLLGADNPDSLRGIYLDGCVMDEVAQMKYSVWGEVIRPTLTDRRGWCLFIGTPKGINQFYELYQYAISGKDKDWFGAVYPVTSTNILPAAEVEAAKNSMTASQFRQEFMCDFQASSDDVLISIDLVEEARGKHLREDHYNRMPKVMAVDIGRDNDPTVIMKRQGLACFEPEELNIADNMGVADVLADRISAWNPDAVFIDQGAGVGVIDRLRQLGFKVFEVPFGSKSSDTQHYANKRAEMYVRVKEWLKAGGAIPNNDKLVADLTCQILEPEAAGRIKLVKKEKIKEMLGRSPDYGDSLALTFAQPVRVKTTNIFHKKREKRRFNVFSRFERVA